MKLTGRYAALLIVLGAIGTYLFLGVYEVALDEAVAQQAPRVHQVLLLTLLGIFRSSRSSSRVDAIGKRYNSTGTGRVWLTTLAGPNTNTVIVITEYLNLVSMAQSTAKVVQAAPYRSSAPSRAIDTPRG